MDERQGPEIIFGAIGNWIKIYLILAPELVMLLNKYQEGIRLNSGAVPAAVNSDDFFATYATEPIESDGKAAKIE